MTPLLTPEQAGAILGVSGSTVRRLLNRGELRGVRIGGQWRLSEQSLTDWVAAHETGAPTASAATPAARVAPTVAHPVGPLIGPAPEEPMFPHLWGLPAHSAALPAAGRGRTTQRTKKRA